MLFKYPACGPAFALGVLLASQALARDAVDIAAAQVDAVPPKTYSLGTNGPSQFDCSGLTWYAFASIGIELPTQAATQAAGGVGTLIVSPKVSDLVRGDLVFFDTFDDDGVTAVTHVGVYEGNGRMLNAVSEDFGLRRSEITASYWVPRLLSARRLPSISGVPSSKFAVGDKVEVTEDGVSVRRLRQQTLLGSRNAGDKGRVDFGPVLQSRGGTAYWWWRVNFDNGVDGWVAESFLDKTSTSNLVTYTFTGVVTELVRSDAAFWAARGINVSVGTTFSGRLVYDTSTGATAQDPSLNSYYYPYALKSFEVTFAGNSKFQAGSPGTISHFTMYVAGLGGGQVRQDVIALQARVTVLGSEYASSLVPISTTPFLDSYPPLQASLPSLSAFDVQPDRAFQFMPVGSGEWIRGRLTLLSKQ